MCDPVTIALAAGTAGLKAGGTLLRGFASSRAGKIEGKIKDENAKLIAAQTLVKENKVRDEVRSTLAAQTAWFAANGIDPASGSPLVLAGLSAAAGEVDARLVRAEGRVAAESEKFGAQQKRNQARQDMVAAIIGAGAELLSAGASAWTGMPKTASAPSVPTPRANPFILNG